jgi:hypothetical protein
MNRRAMVRPLLIRITAGITLHILRVKTEISMLHAAYLNGFLSLRLSI